MSNVGQGNENNAFDKGLLKVGTISDELRKRCIRELTEGLDLHTRASFRKRARGFVDHSKLERDFIESVFKTYGVTDCWGFA